MYCSTSSASLEVENVLNSFDSIENWAWKPYEVTDTVYGTDLYIDKHLLFNLGRTFTKDIHIYPVTANFIESTLPQFLKEDEITDIDLPFMQQVLFFFSKHFFVPLTFVFH